MAEQRDAVGLAIDLAGISRGARLKSIDAKKAESANSILDLMDSLVIHERTLVDHDAPLLEKFLGPQFKGAEVESDLYRKVRVYVSDKTPLESALGVDLIIYQSLYHSFLLIQYKVMEYVKDADKHGWRYKTDAQLEMQLAQIDHVRSRLPTDTGASDMWGFRLNTDPYYFKFCERRKPSSRDDSLVAGMSMSAVHVKDFLANGASLVGYHNCPRYFNNTEFLSVARAGWIGTRDGATGFIEEIIRANQEGGRAAMLAIIDIPRGRTSELRKKKN